MPTRQLLNSISTPDDLRKLSSMEDLILLAEEIRSFLIETLSDIEHAHFSSNLGVVELTIALHYVFNTPVDGLFWDIGHQGYVHKILTGRRDHLSKIRRKNEISGFLNRNEGVYDVFGAGHAGTSISAALGAAAAINLLGENHRQVAIIGDASLVSGMAFEALNHASDLSKNVNLTIVINDNHCSINESVGGLSNYLQHCLPENQSNSFFDSLGLYFFGTIDGHDFYQLIEALEFCKKKEGISVIHCKTKKGKGFQPSELGPAEHWHAPGAFDRVSGNAKLQKTKTRFQDVFADSLIELAAKNSKVVGITAGMLSGTSLKKFQSVFPDRCFDVGIAEQHAVTFAAGLSTQRMVPYCTIYSTFLQRALDQIIHDVALQNLGVIFCVDRAGLVGHDGATHQGVFDISFLSCVPNLVISSPARVEDFRNLLYTAQLGVSNPWVIRYPRGTVFEKELNPPFRKIALGKSRPVRQGKDLMILAVGTILYEVLAAVDFLEAQQINAGICDLIFIKPLDEEFLLRVLSEQKYIVVVEEHVLSGGVGSSIASFILDRHFNNSLLRIGLPDEFVEHASPNEQRQKYRLDAQGISEQISFWYDSRNGQPHL